MHPISVPLGEAVAEKTPEQERDEMLGYAKYLDDQLARSPQRKDVLAGEVKAKVTGLLDEKSALLELACWTGPLSFVVLERPETAEQPLVVATYTGRGEAMPSPDAAR